MQQVFLGIGGNLGDVLATMKKVAMSISSLPEVEEVRFSQVYQTSPVSDLLQPDYLNCACSLLTCLPPLLLFEKLRNIEIDCGKIHKPKNAARTIDIDILLYGDEIMNDDELTIPHPRWQERLFVLIPLAELIESIGSCVLQNQIQKLLAISQDRVELVAEEI